jgi:hypothetical protein
MEPSELELFYNKKILKTLNKGPNFGLLSFFDFGNDKSNTLLTLAMTAKESYLHQAKTKLAQIVTLLVEAKVITGSVQPLGVFALSPIDLSEKKYIVSSIVYTDEPDLIKEAYPELITLDNKPQSDYCDLYL